MLSVRAYLSLELLLFGHLARLAYHRAGVLVNEVLIATRSLKSKEFLRVWLSRALWALQACVCCHLRLPRMIQRQAQVTHPQLEEGLWQLAP